MKFYVTVFILAFMLFDCSPIVVTAYEWNSKTNSGMLSGYTFESENTKKATFEIPTIENNKTATVQPYQYYPMDTSEIVQTRPENKEKKQECLSK